MLQVACGMGHMTVPVGVALVMRHSPLGYDALFQVLTVVNSLCFAILATAILHLRRSFTPASGSLRATQLHSAMKQSQGGEVQLGEQRDHRV